MSCGVKIETVRFHWASVTEVDSMFMAKCWSCCSDEFLFQKGLLFFGLCFLAQLSIRKLRLCHENIVTPCESSFHIEVNRNSPVPLSRLMRVFFAPSAGREREPRPTLWIYVGTSQPPVASATPSSKGEAWDGLKWIHWEEKAGPCL